MDHPNPLSLETQTQITALVRQISVAHHLDAEIQAELASHVEDKLRGYLSGEEKITEPDALLLTTAHFGKPATLKSLLQQVHVRDYGLSLARSLTAAAVATIILGLPNLILNVLWWDLVVVPVTISAAKHNLSASPLLLPQVLFWALQSVLSLGLLYVTFRSWRRRIQEQRPLWFQTVGIRRIIDIFLLLATILVVLQVALIYLRNPLTVPAPNPIYQPVPIWFNAASYTLTLTSSLCNILLWLWWCDRSPRSARSLVYTALAWVGFWVAQNQVILLCYTLISPPTSLPSLYYQIRYALYSMWRTLLNELPVALVILVVYLFFTRRRTARTPSTV